MCCFLLKMKCDTYPYFKSLVVHAISACLDYVFELDTVAFRWIKERKKSLFTSYAAAFGKAHSYNKPGMPNKWQAVFLFLCR